MKFHEELEFFGLECVIRREFLHQLILHDRNCLIKCNITSNLVEMDGMNISS